MDAPSVPRQPFCPVCGRTDLPIEMHHVIHRSQGGHDGPTIPLCKACHMKHHDEGALNFAVWGGVWYWYTDDPHGLTPLVIYNEHEQDCPVSDEELMASDAGELRELFALAARSDWLLSQALARMVDTYGYKPTADLLCDSEGFDTQSVHPYLKKRVKYGRLEGHGVEELGITRGYRVAKLVEKGHRLDNIMRDYRTMSRLQFEEEYR